MNWLIIVGIIIWYVSGFVWFYNWHKQNKWILTIIDMIFPGMVIATFGGILWIISLIAWIGKILHINKLLNKVIYSPFKDKKYVG
jgi:hypothetical protein